MYLSKGYPLQPAQSPRKPGQAARAGAEVVVLDIKHRNHPFVGWGEHAGGGCKAAMRGRPIGHDIQVKTAVGCCVARGFSLGAQHRAFGLTGLPPLLALVLPNGQNTTFCAL